MKSCIKLLTFASLTIHLFVHGLDRGLTPHFSQWLNENGYSSYGFERLDLVGGAYGGKQDDSDSL